MPTISVDQVAKINKIAARIFAPEPSGEVNNAISALHSIFRKNNLKGVDFELVPVGSQLNREHQDDAATASLWTQIADLTMRLNAAHREIDTLKAPRTYGFAEQRVHADLRDAGNAKAKAERDAARRDSAKLRKVLANSTIKLKEANRAKSEADGLRARLAKLEATLEQTNAELIEVIRGQAEAEVRADNACRERDSLRQALEKVTVELHEANQAKAEAEIGAAAVRRECAELRELLEQTKADVREAHGATGALHDTMTANGPTESADAPTDTSVDGVETEEDRSEAVSNEAATERWYGWRRNLGSKAVDLHWLTVQAIDADLAAGRITTRQASGRKAAALRSYKAGAK